MRLFAIIIAALLLVGAIVNLGMAQTADPQFERYFEDATLRIDYYHTANADTAFFAADQLSREGAWAGNPLRLIDPFQLGMYRYAVYDSASNVLIYRKGFSSYCGEYRTTDPARAGRYRTFHESALIPFPRQPVRFVIEARDRRQRCTAVYEQFIHPGDYHILLENRAPAEQVMTVHGGGESHQRVDLVILAEGYSSAEAGKFEADLRRYSDFFFAWAPYDRFKENFNISGVFSPSPESGVDEPRKGIYRNTRLNAGFNALDTERYLLTADNRTMRDLAGRVPYDALMILVNSERYGGGGIYNSFVIFTADHGWPDHMMHHEFGHSFAGLGDEYFGGDVAYSDFYPPGVEPLEANLTRVTDRDQLKWRHLLTPGITIPTDWQKSRYDSLVARSAELRAAMNEEIKRMVAATYPAAAVDSLRAAYETRIAETRTALDAFFTEHPLRGKTGAFQGGGYLDRGISRPTLNSIMHRYYRDEKKFYPVNEAAIVAVIEYYIR